MKNLTEILNSLIIQSKTDNLKWSAYPKEFLDLRMKVSFGQGVPARVTWISFLAPEMRTSEGFYPVYLFYKKENKLILAYGISETSEAKSSWPEEILSSKTKINDYLDNPPRYGDSFVFMDNETYDQLNIPIESIGNGRNFMTGGMNVDLLFDGTEVLDVRLPSHVVLEVIQTDPGFKGNTAQGATKPATVETNYTLNVPLFIDEGDKLKIDTRNGEYVERSKD